MASILAKEKVAQAWGTEFDGSRRAEAFAETLDEVWSQPWLGNATSKELLEELRTRMEINGTLYYATTKCEDQPEK